MIQEHTYANV